MKDLFEEPVFSQFCDLCAIPHGSGNEQALADYVLAFAEEQGLEASRDTTGNVFVRKPAGARGAGKPTVLLQAHMDMVCEKRPDSPHDFRTDPIPLRVDGDRISTGGETSLGADDGIGVAIAMTVLQQDDPDFPAVEALFTVMEEEDLSGARNFDLTQSDAPYLINLDHTCDGDILSGSAGGMETLVSVPLTAAPAPQGYRAYDLKVTGLLGGHSGDDIHRKRGNAIRLLARLLQALAAGTDVRLARLQGGSFRLAIPRDAQCTLLADPAAEETLAAVVAEETARARAALGPNAAGLDVTLAPSAEAPAGDADTVSASACAAFLLRLPDGPQKWSSSFEGLVHTSCNLGEASLDGNTLSLIYELRSASEADRDALFETIRLAAEAAGGTAVHCNEYPAWAFREESPLREHCKAVYRELYGKDPSVSVLHCGLETGCLLQKDPNRDAVSLGPNIWDLHSVSESVDISSVRRVYTYVLELLRKETTHGS